MWKGKKFYYQAIAGDIRLIKNIVEPVLSRFIVRMVI